MSGNIFCRSFPIGLVEYPIPILVPDSYLILVALNRKGRFPVSRTRQIIGHLIVVTYDPILNRVITNLCKNSLVIHFDLLNIPSGQSQFLNRQPHSS